MGQRGSSRQTRMGAGVRRMKLAWREGPVLLMMDPCCWWWVVSYHPETCCGKKQGAATSLGGGFSHNYWGHVFSRDACSGFGGKKKGNYFFLWSTLSPGLPWWLSGKESICQCRRHKLDSCVRKSPWSRKWQLTVVFWPGKSHGQRSLKGYRLWDLKRVRHDWLSNSLY